jgi:hypothetical protein
MLDIFIGIQKGIVTFSNHKILNPTMGQNFDAAFMILKAFRRRTIDDTCLKDETTRQSRWDNICKARISLSHDWP